MNRVVNYLVRFAIIIVGYLVAALAASAFLNVVFLGTAGFTAEEVPMMATGSLIFSIPFVALFVAYFAFVPSIIAIVIGEIIGSRDWLFYAIAGAVVGLVIVGLIRGVAENGEVFAEPMVALTLIGAGMCGGIGYWLVTGRTAGSWRQRPRDVTSPAP